VVAAERKRLVAVFGFSSRDVDSLHPLCLLRLRHAEELAKRALSPMNKVEVVRAELGSGAGMIGAATMALEEIAA